MKTPPVTPITPITPPTPLILVIAGLLLASIPQTLHAGWIRTYGGPYDDYGYWVEQTTDGSYIVTGQLTVEGVAQPEAHVYLIKTDNKGETPYGPVLIPVTTPATAFSRPRTEATLSWQNSVPPLWSSGFLKRMKMGTSCGGNSRSLAVFFLRRICVCERPRMGII